MEDRGGELILDCVVVAEDRLTLLARYSTSAVVARGSEEERDLLVVGGGRRRRVVCGGS